MPYQPTWNNPYLTQNPYQQMMQSQGVQGQQMAQYQQPYGQQPYNGITKVNGPQSAMQINLPPNSISNPLIDSSFDGKRGVFYIVSTDGTGSKSIEAFDFSPHVEQHVQVDNSQFVSRREFDELAARVGIILGALNGIHGPVQQQPAGTTTHGDESQNVHVASDDARGPDPDYQ
jgi:hypothetical protein